MSLIFKKAEELVESMKEYPEDVVNTELRKLNLKQGEYRIDFHTRFPEYEGGKLIGMQKDCKLDKGMYDKLQTFAKENGLKLKNDIPSFIGPTGKIEAYITGGIFAASTSELFEAIGKMLDLKTE